MEDVTPVYTRDVVEKCNTLRKFSTEYADSAQGRNNLLTEQNLLTIVCFILAGFFDMSNWLLLPAVTVIMLLVHTQRKGC